MHPRKLKSALAIGVAIEAMALASPAWSQSSLDSSATGDIVVTARRSEERLQDVPISITVFNQEQISNRNVVTATDLATYTPSLSVNQRFGPEKSAFAIRGFVQENATAPSVGVYFADVPFGRAQGGTTSGGTAPVGSFMDLQNVQVLKGPQGTLFGRNTTGGAVLLVPQRPTDRLEGYVEASVGDYSMKRGQAVLNIPLADTFKIRIAVDRNKREGFMKNHATVDGKRGSQSVGAANFNDVNYFAARLGILAELAPDLENYTVATYSNSFSRGYGGRIIACNPNALVPDQLDPATLLARNYKAIPATTRLTSLSACDQIARQNAAKDGPLDVEISNPNPFIKLRNWGVINTTTWTASDTLTIKNIASYSEINEQSSYNLGGDHFFVAAGGFNAAAVGVPGLVVPAGTPYQHIILNPWQNHTASQSTFTEELQFQGNSSDGRLNWQVGGYVELSRPLGFSAGRTSSFAQCADATNAVCTNPLGFGSLSESATKTSFTTKALFAQATYKLTEQLSVTGGFRYTWDDILSYAQSTRRSLAVPFTTPPRAEVNRCNDIIHYPVAPGSATGKAVSNASECGFSFPVSSRKPTWLIDVDYKPTEDILLYAKWARGYRSGGANPTNVGLETWQPEKVDAYEVGAKTSFRGAVTGYLNFAAFYNDFTSQQLVVSGIASPLVPGFSGSQPIVNAGKSTIKGIEVDASGTFFESLRLDLGYSYVDSELKSFTKPAFGLPYADIVPTAVVGGPLALTPKHRFTATGTFTLPVDESIGRISLSASYIYTSNQFFTRSNDQFAQYLNGTQPVGQLPFITANIPLYGANLGVLPETNLVNVNVNWNNVMGQPVDLGFFVTNLTNQIYPVATGSSTASNGYESFIYGAPRMWGFRLRYSFGN